MAFTDAEAEAAASVAAALMGDMTGSPAVAVAEVEAPEVPVSSTEVGDTVEVEAPAPSFEYSPTIPEDILRELDEAEIDDQVEREIAARPAPVEEEDGFGEFDQPESEDEIRERLRLQKRNQYLEAELAKTKRGSWEAEAKKYFPLADTDEINATSRRAFLKQAKQQHDRILPHVQKVLDEAKGVIDQTRDAAVADGRAAAQAAFGVPLSGPDVTTVEQAANDAAIDAARANARETGSLEKLFKTMLTLGK